MFNKKVAVEADPFEAHFITECEGVTDIQYCTHIHVFRVHQSFLPGVYEYPGNGTLTIDGDIMGSFEFRRDAKLAVRAGDIRLLKHIPTFNKMVASGQITLPDAPEEDDDIDMSQVVTQMKKMQPGVTVPGLTNVQQLTPAVHNPAQDVKVIDLSQETEVIEKKPVKIQRKKLFG